jgi:sugar/nucleoside kinase (ribokinase family)
MMKYDVVALGSARMDCFVNLPEDEVVEVCSVDRHRSMIELGFGEKIPIKGIDFAVGGNTANNAVGIARLGYKTVMIGVMGDGWTDKRAMEVLNGEGVETRYIQVLPGKSGFGVVIGYLGERTILSYYPAAECVFPKENDIEAEWVYLTSMGDGFEGFYKDASEWAKSKSVKIAFNPGTRQIKLGLEGLRYVYEASEVVILNREEAAILLGREPSDDIKELLVGMKNVGTKTVIITDGIDGTYWYDGNRFLHMPVVHVEVVEQTGAGDAFGSGYLGALIAGKSVEEALKWGTVNSASVLGFVGPQAGLLRPEGIGEWLAKAGNLDVEQI